MINSSYDGVDSVAPTQQDYWDMQDLLIRRAIKWQARARLLADQVLNVDKNLEGYSESEVRYALKELQAETQREMVRWNNE